MLDEVGHNNLFGYGIVIVKVTVYSGATISQA